MREENEKIIQSLTTIKDKLEQGKISLHDIPVDEISDLLSAVFMVEPLAETHKESLLHDIEIMYSLSEHCGDTTQQGAVFGMLDQLLRIWWGTDEIREDEKVQAKKELWKYQETEKLLNLYYEDKLTDNYISEHTWGSVVDLKDGKDVNLFWEICTAIQKKNIERIKKQSKIRVAFLTKDSAEWSADALYQSLANDERYEVSVMVAPFFVGSEITVKDTYELAVQYFREKGYRTVPMCKIEDQLHFWYHSWEEIQKPDIIFMLNPHYTAFEGSSKVSNFPMQSLIAYIPYGFSLYGNIHDQYNQLSHALCWKIFWESSLDVEISKKYADLGDRNAEMSGYLKMDGFYLGEEPDIREIWKIPEGLDEKKVKKIIYAPHWSVREAVTGFGNFDKIYDEMYEYAKNHADTTSWIFRPHPMLRAGVVVYGVFQSEQEFDDYMRKWDELPNAKVVERGEYLDVFRTSDALVGDSISFLGEYQYTHKPLLLLTRKENTFDDFGKKLLPILYTAPGDDFKAIASFIQKVVIEQQDEMYDQRKQFFDMYLDYRKQNGKLACEYIKELLDKTFESGMNHE